MTGATALQIDDLTLTRVLYADVTVPPERVGLTVDDVRAVPWRRPLWAGDDDTVGASASAWVIDHGTRRVVLEPLQAADEVLHDPAAHGFHQDAFAQRMAEDGFDVATVDTVVISHIETIGMVGRRADDDTWSPLFPNARIVIPEAALEYFDRSPGDFPSSAVWRQFIDEGRVDTVADGAEIVPGMRAELTGAHNPGHTVFHFGAEPQATWLGHLALNPMHLVTGLCPAQHPEPERAWEILQGYRDDGRWLLAPLWPSPGVGRWDAGTFRAGTER
jgi:glyoxylase-like metal-dependent hydrolase (beta-lactamase superfamily II)